MKKDRGGGSKLYCLLFSVFVSSVCTSGIAGTAGPADEHYNGLLIQHPAPTLTPEAWRVVFSTEQIAETQKLTSKLRINVVQGTIKSVEIKVSTGVKIVDQELVRWIQTEWHFRANITGDFTLPVGIPLPAILNIWGPERSLHKMMLRVVVDQGVIKNVYVLQSSGDRVADVLAAMWVRQNWLFTKDQSGEFEMPVYLRAHLR